jgi:P-aminobenzoate N-oxygenase AurF
VEHMAPAMRDGSPALRLVAPAPEDPITEDRPDGRPDDDHAPGDEEFGRRVSRLSNLSTGTTFDAYRDIDWDDPALSIDASDPRFVLPLADPLGASAWYLALPEAEQARLGLLRVTACLTTAWQFENLLQQGLLHRALRDRGGAAEFRYMHHEIIEESQHTLMFHEFVDRTGLSVRGMPWSLRRLTEVGIGTLARLSPAVFFVLVLGGEDPVDVLNHQVLATGHTHPLLERIVTVHIAEEARHISYARAALRRDVPRLGWLRRHILAAVAPFALGIMVRLMMLPGRDVRRGGPVPREVIRQAYRSPEGRVLFATAVRRPRVALRELGAETRTGRAIWRAFGIWDADRTR